MIYELREYVAADGATDKLHARFADHTLDLFAKHDMAVTGFWRDAENPGTVVYVLRFPDEQTRNDAWAAFQSDPEWKEVKAASEADGPIVTEMTSRLLTDVSYWQDPTSTA